MHQLNPEEEKVYWSEIFVDYEPYYAYEEVLAAFVDLPSQTSSMLAKMEALAGYLIGNPLSRTETIDEVRRAEGLAAFATRSAGEFGQELAWLGDEYESICRKIDAGYARTELMGLLVDRAQILGGQRDAGATATDLFNRGTDGGRVVGLALARIDPLKQHIDLALSSIREMRSAFEQYHALLLTEMLLPLLDDTAANQLWSAIGFELGATICEDDQDRWALAQRLIEKLGATTNRHAPSESKSQKPLIYISYAHADEPERPRGGEIRWLSFVMKFLRPALKSGEFAIWLDRLDTRRYELGQGDRA